MHYQGLAFSARNVRTTRSPLADELPLPDFNGKLSRAAAARAICAPRRRKLVMKRAVVLAAVIAVPALAAPGSFGSAAAPQADNVQPLGFEIPGESFPGSAFYYLENVPQIVPAASSEADAASLVLSSPASSLIDAARPVRVAGSDSDHARAQRCMTQAIYYEAASESDAGQRAVAQVVLNRVTHSAWPNTVCGVVYQGSERTTGCQFSFTCDGSLARQPSAIFWARASRIAREALAGSVYAPVGFATHYHTLAVHPYWADSLTQVTVIGAHQFYRWPGAAGSRAAFSMRHRGGEPLPGRVPTSPPAPNPLSPPELPGAVVMDNFVPVIPVASAAPEAAPVPADNLPVSGSVRSEYANSGAWLVRP